MPEGMPRHAGDAHPSLIGSVMPQRTNPKPVYDKYKEKRGFRFGFFVSLTQKKL